MWTPNICPGHVSANKGIPDPGFVWIHPGIDDCTMLCVDSPNGMVSSACMLRVGVGACLGVGGGVGVAFGVGVEMEGGGWGEGWEL